MNKFIKCIMRNRQFRCNILLNFENDTERKSVDAILDTGCSHSHISIDAIYTELDTSDKLKLKKKYMGHRHVVLGRGVESANRPISHDKTDVNNKNIRLVHNCKNIELNGVALGDIALNISYDTSKIALIGMEVLQNWVCYIDKNKDGDIVFMGCPRDKLNQEFLIALQNEFNLGTNIDACIINNKIVMKKLGIQFIGEKHHEK